MTSPATVERAAARRRHPTARPWRVDPDRLRARLVEALVVEGRRREEAQAEARAAEGAWARDRAQRVAQRRAPH